MGRRATQPAASPASSMGQPHASPGRAEGAGQARELGLDRLVAHVDAAVVHQAVEPLSQQAAEGLEVLGGGWLDDAHGWSPPPGGWEHLVLEDRESWRLVPRSAESRPASGSRSTVEPPRRPSTSVRCSHTCSHRKESATRLLVHASQPPPPTDPAVPDVVGGSQPSQRCSPAPMMIRSGSVGRMSDRSMMASDPRAPSGSRKPSAPRITRGVLRPQPTAAPAPGRARLMRRRGGSLANVDKLREAVEVAALFVQPPLCPGSARNRRWTRCRALRAPRGRGRGCIRRNRARRSSLTRVRACTPPRNRPAA